MGPSAVLWIHGHTHESFDYVVNGTRVVCNPRGYAPRDLNPAFDPGLTVDVQVNERARRDAIATISSDRRNEVACRGVSTPRRHRVDYKTCSRESILALDVTKS
jgi:hypothetical protein